MLKPTYYISTDIEADGRAPGLSSMLSFASVALTLDKMVVGSFSRNLDLLDNALPSPDTSEFWSKNQYAYQATRVAPIASAVAMPEYAAWLNGLGGNIVFVAYPACYDWKWIDWYLIRFVGGNPFGFQDCMCIRNLAWAMLRSEWHKTHRNMFPARWFDNLPHTHVAHDDALEQGALFINMLREHRSLDRAPLTYRN